MCQCHSVCETACTQTQGAVRSAECGGPEWGPRIGANALWPLKTDQICVLVCLCWSARDGGLRDKPVPVVDGRQIVRCAASSRAAVRHRCHRETVGTGPGAAHGRRSPLYQRGPDLRFRIMAARVFVRQFYSAGARGYADYPRLTDSTIRS